VTSDPRARPATTDEIRAARERLDAAVRDVVAWHFDPQTGTPFWLEYARRLDWDPREEVRRFEDLARFAPFEAAWLHGGPATRWVPKGYAGRPVHVFDTAGASGIVSRIEIEDFRLDYGHFAETLPDAAFPRGTDWLAIGPTGPRRFRLALEHLAQTRGGIAFGLDLDPRWVAKCLERGAVEAAGAYQAHVIDQALVILRSQPNVRCLFTSPRLLEALCDKVSLKKVGITGVVCGGTPMDSRFHRHAHQEMLEGAAFVPIYTNTLLGIAGPKPFVPEDEYAITYHAAQPRAVLQVVDPRRPDREVAYGERGRVKITTLTREFFLPGFLERDEAVRSAPIALHPWDGFRDPRPFSGLEAPLGAGVS
jgi:hypothetical protein